METKRELIRKILRDALDAALVERDTASETFDEILCDVPSRLTQTDGASRIKSASSTLSVARERMNEAMIRLREFDRQGIIPEDLKRKPAQKEGAARQARSEKSSPAH